MTKKHKFREKLEYYSLAIFVKLCKVLPVSLVFAITKAFANLVFYLVKSRRELSIQNLTLAYPNLSENEAYNLTKQNYHSLAITAAEALLVYVDRLKLADLLIEPELAIQKIDELSQNGSKPILFTTAHFGNWEVLANYVGSKGHNMVVIGREGNNTLIEQNFTRPSRLKFGNDLAYKDNAMSAMVRNLRGGKNVGILIDQKGGSTNAIKTTFFNRPCTTPQTIGALVLKYRPVVIPIFSLREPSGKYKIIIKQMRDLKLSGNKEDDMRLITQEINDIFQSVVKLDPTQWFWMHNRWKM
ncbi:MAG: acyltransferase [Campylobacter sp.]|nr:acyltransferase [Campylobacter sp.]